jgi:transposase
MDEEIFVGIDWAWQEHQVVAIDSLGKTLCEFVVEHSGQGLIDLRKKLLDLAGGDINKIKVGIEVPHGAIVESLLDNLFAVYSINPKQLDRFRDRYSPSGAKDDRRDAFVMADSLRTDQSCFRRLTVSDPLVIELREWSRMADEIQAEKVRQANRFREQLLRYYPQFLQLGTDIADHWVLTLWEKAPTPDKGRRLPKSTIKKILQANRIRKHTAESIHEILRQPPLEVAKGVEQAAVAHLTVLIERIRLANRQHKQAQDKLEQLCQKLSESSPPECDRGGQSDVTILLSLKGVGITVAATLLAEASQPLRDRDYHVLRILCGVAPVTKRSGKMLRVQMRYASNKRLRNAVYHWARVASYSDPVSKQAYSALRQRGDTHGHALRSLGDRLLNVACAMLRDGTSYDPTKRKSYSTLEKID